MSKPATQSGRTVAEDTGWVAFKAKGTKGRVTLHLLRDPTQTGLPLGDPQTLTVCGRYKFECHTGTETVPANAPRCGVCTGAQIERRRERFGM